MSLYRDAYIVACKMTTGIKVNHNLRQQPHKSDWSIRNGISFICKICGKKFKVEKRIGEICESCADKMAGSETNNN